MGGFGEDGALVGGDGGALVRGRWGGLGEDGALVTTRLLPTPQG